MAAAKLSWIHGRFARIGFMLLALSAAYGLASRAIFTGSLQQYGLALVLLALSVGLFVKLVRHA